jgi:hypothetical protein
LLSLDCGAIAVSVVGSGPTYGPGLSKVADYFTQGRRGWVRLHDKGGKEHEVPCHHLLERVLVQFKLRSSQVSKRVVLLRCQHRIPDGGRTSVFEA